MIYGRSDDGSMKGPLRPPSYCSQLAVGVVVEDVVVVVVVEGVARKCTDGQ